jgi:hypothetical protein
MNNINNIFRGIGILIFLLILIMDDFFFYKKMKEPYVQLILAIFIICLLIYDYITGFIYCMILLLIYYEIYKKIEKKNIPNNNFKYVLNYNDKNKYLENFTQNDIINKDIIQLDYINEKYLQDAQNNIIDINIYDNDTKIKNIDTEDSYCIQGLNKDIKGFNKSDNLINNFI